jgi:hypothetical protein
MKHIFKVAKQYKIPDGTIVAPFMNPYDSNSTESITDINDISISEGIIEGFGKSKIQIFPYVNQITYVLEGKLKVIMKGQKDKGPYSLVITKNDSVITYKNEFLQLVNETSESCRVLYIVSPAYVYEIENGEVVYDDSIILDKSWEELKKANWKIDIKCYDKIEREKAIKRIISGRKK